MCSSACVFAERASASRATRSRQDVASTHSVGQAAPQNRRSPLPKAQTLTSWPPPPPTFVLPSAASHANATSSIKDWLPRLPKGLGTGNSCHWVPLPPRE